MDKQHKKSANEQTFLPCSQGSKTALLEWSILLILLSCIMMAATI